MNKSRLLGAVCTCLTAISYHANAVVLNTLNGVDYEWLELTETAGQSRVAVQAQIDAASPVDVLYGYEYAPRTLIEDLFLSYSPWDGLSGWHGEPTAATGTMSLMTDFGILTGHARAPGSSITTVDGYGTIPVDFHIYASGYYGELAECGTGYTCVASIDVLLNGGASGTPVAAHIAGYTGWDAAHPAPNYASTTLTSTSYGSYLVRPAVVVPIPASVWLFGSGLLGLVGVARRKA